MLKREKPLYFTRYENRNEFMHMIYRLPNEDDIVFVTGPKSINYCNKMKFNFEMLVGMDSYWYVTEKYIIDNDLEKTIYDLYRKAERYLELQKLAHDTDMTEFIEIINELLEATSYDVLLEMCKSMDLPMYNISPVEFDKSIELEQRGTRTQSYTREDHIELIAFISYLRIVSPIIMAYMNINTYTIGKYHMELKMTDMLINHTYLNNIDAFIKMEQSIAMSVRTAINKLPIEEIQRVIQSKGIDEDTLPLYALSIALTHIILTHNVFKDNKDVQVMSIYTSKAINSIKITKTTNQLANKKITGNGLDDDKSTGMLEAYKASTTLSMADIALGNFIYQDLYNYKLYGKLNKSNYKKIYNDMSIIYKSNDPLKNTLTQGQLKLITELGYLVYPSDAYKLIDNDSLHTLIAHVFTWLWDNGYRELALYITAVRNPDNVLDITGNINMAIDRYDDNKLEKLKETFGYENEEGILVDHIKTNIDIIVKHMYTEKWFILATSFTDKTYWYVPKIRNMLLDVFMELYHLYTPMVQFK